MCTWLCLKFDCGASKKTNQIISICKHFEHRSCAGRGGQYHLKFLDTGFPCLGMVQNCNTCPERLPSVAAIARFMAAVEALVNRELAARDAAIILIAAVNGYSVEGILEPRPGPVSQSQRTVSQKIYTKADRKHRCHIFSSSNCRLSPKKAQIHLISSIETGSSVADAPRHRNLQITIVVMSNLYDCQHQFLLWRPNTFLQCDTLCIPQIAGSTLIPTTLLSLTVGAAFRGRSDLRFNASNGTHS